MCWNLVSEPMLMFEYFLVCMCAFKFHVYTRSKHCVVSMYRHTKLVVQSNGHHKKIHYIRLHYQWPMCCSSNARVLFKPDSRYFARQNNKQKGNSQLLLFLPRYRPWSSSPATKIVRRSNSMTRQSVSWTPSGSPESHRVPSKNTYSTKLL